MGITQLPPPTSDFSFSTNSDEAVVPGNVLRAEMATSLVADGEEQGKISVHSDITFANGTGTETESAICESETSQIVDSSTLQRPNARVRFRSRVRITSGLNLGRRRNASFSIEGAENGNGQPLSPASSLSGSPSSSVSAPLRSRDDDEVGKPGWGTLGQRVGLFAQRRRMGDRSISSPRINHYSPKSSISENSPLLRSTYGSSYETNRSNICESDEEARLSKEIDLVFGTWPRRLLNYHWWWWRLEPVICCHCIEDSDTEE